MPVFKKDRGYIFGVQFNSKEQKAIDAEILRQCAEFNRKNELEMDSVILWVLHERFGCGEMCIRDRLNTVSGAQENRYNDLYDPLPTRSLRISGQLFLTVLTMRLLNACKTIRLLNLNTDGLMYSIDKSELAFVDEIVHAWEAETKFELEVDDIQRVWIKDVNNLLIIKTNGEVKTVGGYLNYGVSVKGAWAINNNMVIVKKALIEYCLLYTSRCV